MITGSLTEPTRETCQLLRRQCLVTEENRNIFEEGLMDLVEDPVAEVPRQVDALNLGAERPGDRLHVDCLIAQVPLLARRDGGRSIMASGTEE